jgi:hypothetical protein
MKGELLAVVQKEEWGACFYGAEASREVLAVFFLVDRAYAKFVADAVFGAHEFGAREVSQLISLGGLMSLGILESQLGNVSSGFFIDMCRKLVCDILLIGNLVKWRIVADSVRRFVHKGISAGLSVEDVFFYACLLVQLFGDGAPDAIEC